MRIHLRLSKITAGWRRLKVACVLTTLLVALAATVAPAPSANAVWQWKFDTTGTVQFEETVMMAGVESILPTRERVGQVKSTGFVVWPAARPAFPGVPVTDPGDFGTQRVDVTLSLERKIDYPLDGSPYRQWFEIETKSLQERLVFDANVINQHVNLPSVTFDTHTWGTSVQFEYRVVYRIRWVDERNGETLGSTILEPGAQGSGEVKEARCDTWSVPCEASVASLWMA